MTKQPQPDDSSFRLALEVTRRLRIKHAAGRWHAEVIERDGAIIKIDATLRDASGRPLFVGKWFCLPDEMALAELEEMHRAIIERIEKKLRDE